MTDALPGDTGIRTPDQRLRVFVSSTLAELADERRAVSRAISTLRLTPVMFELGARPHPPRELYRAYLAQSDIFIGEALGADRFDEVFAAGSRLNQQDAVAAVRDRHGEGARAS